MELKIEKDVPLPSSGSGSGGKFSSIIAQMTAGDSVPFETKAEAKRFHYALQYKLKGRPEGCAMRELNGKWRVWMTPKKFGGGRKAEK